MEVPSSKIEIDFGSNLKILSFNQILIKNNLENFENLEIFKLETKKNSTLFKFKLVTFTKGNTKL